MERKATLRKLLSRRFIARLSPFAPRKVHKIERRNPFVERKATLDIARETRLVDHAVSLEWSGPNRYGIAACRS